MSNVSNDNSKGNENLPKESDPKEEKFVPKTAYEEVSKDMHKYKSKVKDAEARAAELEARMKAIEEAKLMEEKRFEELYQKERDAREKAENALKQTNEHYIRSVKMTALMRELGNIKPKYLQHANLDEIIVRDDGSLSSESVVAVANKFRQENPELVPTTNAGNLNDVAPTNTTITTNKTVDMDKLSLDEKREIIAKATRAPKKMSLHQSN